MELNQIPSGTAMPLLGKLLPISAVHLQTSLVCLGMGGKGVSPSDPLLFCSDPGTSSSAA